MSIPMITIATVIAQAIETIIDAPTTTCNAHPITIAAMMSTMTNIANIAMYLRIIYLIIYLIVCPNIVNC